MKKGLLGGPDPVLPPAPNKIQYTGGGPYSVSSTISLGSHYDYKRYTCMCVCTLLCNVNHGDADIGSQGLLPDF